MTRRGFCGALISVFPVVRSLAKAYKTPTLPVPPAPPETLSPTCTHGNNALFCTVCPPLYGEIGRIDGVPYVISSVVYRNLNG